jgi:glycosyltransferase involved in cell wall biosynthesis
MSVKWFDRETLEQVIADQIQPVDVVLDIGCGIRPQTFFEPKLSIFCEPHSKYVQILQNRFLGQPNVVILQGTWQEALKFLPDQSVDSVFLLDVIEHLEKGEGLHLLEECERLARKQIVIFTPLGFMPQNYEMGQGDAWGLDGGEYQVHKSGWTPKDFNHSWDISGSLTYHTVNGKGEAVDPPRGAFYAIQNHQRSEFSTLPVKLAVLSHILPPSPSGQSVMLYRLLKNFMSRSYCLLSRENYNPYWVLQKSLHRLPARYYDLPPELEWPLPKWLGFRQIRQGLNLLLRIFQRGLSIQRIVKQEKCNALLACTGDIIDLPAGYLATRLAHIPFYAYLFDDYTYQWAQRFQRFFARKLEKIMLRGSAGVIVPNEFLQDEIERRHGIQCFLIRNACESLPEQVDQISWPSEVGRVKIVYTGAVYHAHYDAFRNLLKAIPQIEGPEIKVHLFTAQRPTDLEQENVCGPVVFHPHVAPAQVIEVQRQADILFLPLAFDSSIPEVIKTSAPGKMAEYLASGRPILVHAPAHSFLSWYFEKHECGLVVDRNESMALVQAIRRMIEDEALRKHLIKNALACAKRDFDPEVARAGFLKLFQPIGKG